MASTTRRVDEGMQREHQEATVRSIDETRDNVRRAIEEATREAPRFAQTVTDFHKETADATKEMVDTFLESQKEVIISMQDVWTDVGDRTGFWTGGMQPWNFYWWLPGGGMLLPIAMANLYARMIAHMTVNFAVGARMASNMMFAAFEAARATTKYARDNSKEISRMISINARVTSRTTKEVIKVQGELAGSTSPTGGAATSEDERSAGRGEIGGSARRK